jgi:hypothetical protein
LKEVNALFYILAQAIQWLAHSWFNRANTSCSVVPLFHSLLNYVDYVLSLIAGFNCL